MRVRCGVGCRVLRAVLGVGLRAVCSLRVCGVRCAGFGAGFGALSAGVRCRVSEGAWCVGCGALSGVRCWVCGCAGCRVFGEGSAPPLS